VDRGEVEIDRPSRFADGVARPGCSIAPSSARRRVLGPAPRWQPAGEWSRAVPWEGVQGSGGGPDRRRRSSAQPFRWAQRRFSRRARVIADDTVLDRKYVSKEVA